MSDQETQAPIEVTPEWFIDDSIPGVGPRPSWLPEKFKSIAELAKSHNELDKRFGAVPEDYDFSKSKYLDPDYVPFHELKKFAKEKRVSQDVFDKMFESIDKYMDEFTVNDNEEIEKLGPNARERLETLNNWTKANLSQDSYEALTGNLRNAEAVKALEELRSKFVTNTTQIPSGNDGAIHNVASLEDVKIELANNLAKYKSDPKYREDISKRLEIAAKNSGYVDKRGP